MSKLTTIPVLAFLVLSFLSAISFAADASVEVYDLRHHTHPSFTRIVVDIGALREYSFHRLTSPDRLYIDIFQARLNPILHGKVIAVTNSYLHRIRIAQRTASTVRVVIDLEFNKIKRHHVFYLPDPFRVVIDIYPEKAADQLDPAAPRPAAPAKSGYSLVRQLGLGVERIVIDPGHGGSDPGALGRSGLKEKDIVLDVCQRLKKLFETKGNPEVILTRESDITMPLENRPVIANQKQADIFISVHANSFPSSRRSGVETFYLNFSEDPSVNAIAARENATSTKNIGRMKKLIDQIVRNSKIVESKELAQRIQTNLVQTLRKDHKDVRDLGVKGSPFWVLIGGEIPSVLIEISHLSNATEESRLKSSQYRQRIAEGIYHGIIDYINSLGKG